MLYFMLCMKEEIPFFKSSFIIKKSLANTNTKNKYATELPSQTTKRRENFQVF